MKKNEIDLAEIEKLLDSLSDDDIDILSIELSYYISFENTTKIPKEKDHRKGLCTIPHIWSSQFLLFMHRCT